MSLLREVSAAVGSLERRHGDHAAQAVHLHLRQLILTGVLPADVELNQQELAPLLGVSATPVREAIRMLQEEGLIDAAPQKRARVRGFEPRRVESLYVERIMLESLGARMTAISAGVNDIEQLHSILEDMQEFASPLPTPEWHAAHKRFHLAVVSALGETLLEGVSARIDRCARYMFMHGPENTNAWSYADGMHRAIAEGITRRDADAAASAVVGDLARGALLLLAYFAPQYEPVVIRAALSQWRAEGRSPQ